MARRTVDGMGFFSRGSKPQPQQHVTFDPTADLSGRPSDSIVGMAGEGKSGSLIDLRKKAGVSLEKSNLSGVRAAVYLVLDHSGSMSSFYRDKSVQGFSEQVLALGATLDDDGSIPVILFDTVAHPAEDLILGQHSGRIQEIKDHAGRMGTTNYAAAIQAVAELHARTYPGRDMPGLVVFQTDGNPDNRTAAEKALCAVAGQPLFFSFVGFGREKFDFLKKLDELAVPSKRVIDNASFFSAGEYPSTFPADQLYAELLKEFPEWLNEVRRAGILN